MKNKKVLLLFFLFFIGIIGYNFFQSIYTKPIYTIEFFKNDTIKSVEYSENQVSESFGFGVYRNYNPPVGMNLTQLLKENESFEGYIRITNAIKRENSYLVFALVDYRMVPIFINGTKNQTHLINLDPMEDRFYSFKIDNLSNGYHDLILGVFLNPYEHSLDKKYRLDTDFSLMGSTRLNIVVENGSIPEPEFRKPEIFCESSYVLEGLLVSKEPCSSKAWPTENVTRKEALDYFINIGNSEQRNQRTFAVIQFLDYTQIPLIHNTSEYVYFGYLDKGKKGSISASTIIPDNTGIHELIVIWISDPYKRVEISPGIRNKNIEGRIEPSIRVGLNVIEK
ncbi:Uncharacterised protein [uncultured archaeon]|nr:Uncharacterised protein [uncultured archaeon]